MDGHIVDSFWSRLEFALGEFSDFLQMPLETSDEAIGERIAPATNNRKADWRDTGPRWVDEDHGRTVRAWGRLPFNDAVNRDFLKERIDAGKKLLPSVRRRVAARELSPELIQEWGQLCQCAGAVELVYFSESNTGRLREGSKNLEGHKYWYSIYYLRIYKRGRAEQAHDTMELFVNNLIRDAPGEADPHWLSQFLGPCPSQRWSDARQLSGKFRDDLSVASMKKYAGHPAPLGIAPLNLVFPPP